MLLLTESRSYAEGLASLIAADGRLRCAACVSTPAEAGARADRADAVLVDAASPTALEALRALRDMDAGVAIVVVNFDGSGEELIACFESGATAFLARDASAHRIIDVVISAIHGDALVSTDETVRWIRRLATRARRVEDPAPGNGTAGLTLREREVALLLALGLSNKEIAGRLQISRATVKNHVHHILSKLQVRRRMDAAVRLRRLPPAERVDLGI